MKRPAGQALALVVLSACMTASQGCRRAPATPARPLSGPQRAGDPAPRQPLPRWALGVGSVMEYETIREVPERPEKTTFRSRWTVIRQDSVSMTFRIEDGDGKDWVTTHQTLELPFALPKVLAPPDANFEALPDEWIQLPGGRFFCAHVRGEAPVDGGKVIEETWSPSDMPRHVKKVTTASGPLAMRLTDTLVRFDRAPPVLSEDARTSGRLPFNPGRDARVGDWALYDRVTTLLDGSQSRSFEVRRVTEGGEQEVTISVTGDAYTLTVTGSRSRAPLDVDLVATAAEHPRPGRFERAQRTVNGRVFDGYKLPFEDDVNERSAIWFSPEVKAGGVVAEIIRTRPFQGRSVTDEWTLRGFGTAAGAIWGDGPEKVMAPGTAHPM